MKRLTATQLRSCPRYRNNAVTDWWHPTPIDENEHVRPTATGRAATPRITFRVSSDRAPPPRCEDAHPSLDVASADSAGHPAATNPLAKIGVRKCRGQLQRKTPATLTRCDHKQLVGCSRCYCHTRSTANTAKYHDPLKWSASRLPRTYLRASSSTSITLNVPRETIRFTWNRASKNFEVEESIRWTKWSTSPAPALILSPLVEAQPACQHRPTKPRELVPAATTSHTNSHGA